MTKLPEEPARNSLLLTVLPVTLAPLALFAPMLLGGRVLFWGTPSLQFIPWLAYAWETLLAGGLPLWNPLNGMGAPLAANYQTALLYPLNWLSLPFYGFGGAPALAWVQTLLVALHLAWAGLGMAALLRGMGYPPASQVVSGLAFGLCAFLVARVSFFSMIWSVAWLPWVVHYAVKKDPITPNNPTLAGRGGPDASFFLLVACLTLQLLSGHAQLTWYTLLLAAAWALLHGGTAAGWRGMAKALLRLGAAAAAAVLISAVQLLPTAELLLQSQRADSVDAAQGLTYSLWPWRLLGFIAPDLFGSPALGNYWGYATYWEDAVYLGLIPFLLACGSLAIVFSRRPDARAARPVLIFLWGLAGASVVLALGKDSALFMLLFEHVPTFNLFNSPARYLIWAEFSLALLAGISLAHWQPPSGKALYWARLATAGTLAITLGAWLSQHALEGARATIVRAAALVGPWALGAGLLALTTPSLVRCGLALPLRFRNLWSAALAVWVAADLLYAGWAFNPGIEAGFYRAAPAGSLPAGLAEGQRLFLPYADEYELKFNRFFRFDSFAAQEPWQNLRQAALPNLNLLDGIASANNFEPMVPARYAVWMAHLKDLPDAQLARWLALMGVGVIETAGEGLAGGVQFRPVAGAQRYRWAACAVGAEDGSSALAQVSALLDDPDPAMRLQRVVVEGLPEAGEPLPDCSLQAGVSELLDHDPGRIILQIDAPQNGWLVAADTWYPGWQARIDGVETPVYRANYLFRAVKLPAGQHTVEFVYRPASFYIGAVVSVLTLVLGLWVKICCSCRLRAIFPFFRFPAAD